MWWGALAQDSIDVDDFYCLFLISGMEYIAIPFPLPPKTRGTCLGEVFEYNEQKTLHF
jgi:hypothetical protein